MNALATRPRLGVLLLNVGSPDAPETAEVRQYLRQFLGDPRVLDMNGALRFLILEGAILPFRPAKSAAAYKKVWRPEGAPLVHFTRLQRDALAKAMPEAKVYFGMRYGNPSVASAIAALRADGIEDLCVIPMYPQYASASTTSALEELNRQLSLQPALPNLRVVGPFYRNEGFLDGVVHKIKEAAAALKADHVLFSYHGLPQRQVKACGSAACFTDGCCDTITAANQSCYRAQCLHTSTMLAKRLGLGPQEYSVSFQSRLGRDPWILPNTETVLSELAKKGVKRLAVACPSFVADCLETLEEIGIRGQEQFTREGGEALVQVPCVNDDPRFIAGLAELARHALGLGVNAGPTTVQATG